MRDCVLRQRREHAAASRRPVPGCGRNASHYGGLPNSGTVNIVNRANPEFKTRFAGQYRRALKYVGQIRCLVGHSSFLHQLKPGVPPDIFQ